MHLIYKIFHTLLTRNLFFRPCSIGNSNISNSKSNGSHVLQEVKVSNPDGVVMTRWSDVGTTSGLVDLKYAIDDEAKLGKWKISATRAGSTVSKDIQEVREFQVSE